MWFESQSEKILQATLHIVELQGFGAKMKWHSKSLYNGVTENFVSPHLVFISIYYVPPLQTER